MAKQDGFTLTGYQTEAGNILEMISLAEKSAYVSITNLLVLYLHINTDIRPALCLSHDIYWSLVLITI